MIEKKIPPRFSLPHEWENLKTQRWDPPHPDEVRKYAMNKFALGFLDELQKLAYSGGKPIKVTRDVLRKLEALPPEAIEALSKLERPVGPMLPPPSRPRIQTSLKRPVAMRETPVTETDELAALQEQLANLVPA